MRGDVRAAWEVAHLQMNVDSAWADEQPACMAPADSRIRICLPSAHAHWLNGAPSGVLTWYWP